MEIILNPYQITWIEFRPTKGIATKADIKLIYGSRFGREADCRTGCFYMHFPNKALAMGYLHNLGNIAHKLAKPYECRFFTDQQFGMRTWNNPEVPITTKQRNEVIILK